MTYSMRPLGCDPARIKRMSERLIVSHYEIAPAALFSVPALGSNALAAEKSQKLQGARMRAKLTGMELTDEVHWGDLYERNGTLTNYSMGRKRVGRWGAQNHELCIDLGEEPGSRCYQVWLSKTT